MIEVRLKDGTDIRFPSDYVGYADIQSNRYTVYKEMNDPNKWVFELSNIDSVCQGGRRII